MPRIIRNALLLIIQIPAQLWDNIPGAFPWYEQFMVHECIPGIAGDNPEARAKAGRKLFICPSDSKPNYAYQNFKTYISYGYNRY